MASILQAPARSLAMIHTVSGLIQVFDALAKRHLPLWHGFSLLDESLLQSTIRDGSLSKLTMRRLTGMIWSAADAGAQAIVVTCSSLGSAVDAARPLCPVPLFRIDEGMALAAVGHGPRIGVLATLGTTLVPTSDLIQRTAQRLGRDCTLTAQTAEGAFERLRLGDAEGHDLVVAQGLGDLAQRVDVIVLAQASMARALASVKDDLGAASPDQSRPWHAIYRAKPDRLGPVDVYLVRITVAASEMKALKLSSVLQQRMAIPLYSLSFPKKFSIRCRHLQVSRSNSAGNRRLGLGGMTAVIPALVSRSRSQFACKRPIGKELTAGQPLDQRSCPAQVVGLSRQQTEVDQVAKRVGQGHDLAGHTATRAPDGLALSPPFAPCP